MRFGGFSELSSSRSVERIRPREVEILGPRNLERSAESIEASEIAQKIFNELFDVDSDINQSAVLEYDPREMRFAHRQLFADAPMTPETHEIAIKATRNQELMTAFADKKLASRFEGRDFFDTKKADGIIEAWKKENIPETFASNPMRGFKEINEIQEVRLYPRNNDSIQKEAQKRLADQRMQVVNAQKAQAFYNSLSDSTCNKSAAESARFMEKEFNKSVEKEVQERLDADLKAQKAQAFYNSLSDSTCGKDATESGEFIKAVKDEVDLRNLNQATEKYKTERAQALYGVLTDSTYARSEIEAPTAIKPQIETTIKNTADEVIQNVDDNIKPTTNEFVEVITDYKPIKPTKTTKTFMERLSSLFNNKKFKWAAGILALLTMAGVAYKTYIQKQTITK